MEQNNKQITVNLLTNTENTHVSVSVSADQPMNLTDLKAALEYFITTFPKPEAQEATQETASGAV